MTRKRTYQVALFCFFCSGMAGLIFETVWARAFSIVLGNSLEGISIVVALFLGGLGLGGALSAQLADRTRNPLKVYAIIECGIGLWGLMGIRFLPSIPRLIMALVPSSSPSGPLLTAARLTAAALFLAPPTFAMGLTLPVLTAGLSRGRTFLASLGSLYAINTLGALSGVGFGGFLLLPVLGAARTTAVAAIIDLSVAVTVLALAPRKASAHTAREEAPAPASAVASPAQATKQIKKKSVSASPSKKQHPPAVVKLPAAPTPALAGIFAVAGAVAMLCELGWTRALTLVLGSSSYTFSIILAAFLGGSGGGALLWRFKKRELKTPMLAYACIWTAFVATLLLSLWVLDHSPNLFLEIYWYTHSSRMLILGGLFFLASATVLPCAVLLGLHFPLTGDLLRSAGEGWGKSTGRAVLWNSLGTLGGSLLAGFVILPALGSAAALRLCASLALALAGLLFSFGLPFRTVPRIALLAVAFLCAGLTDVYGPGLDSLLHHQGVFRSANPLNAGAVPREEFVQSTLKLMSNKKAFFLKDGHLSTVAIWYDDAGNLSLTVGGKTDASYHDMETQMLGGQVPMILHPNPQSVFLVGYGSGITAYSVLLFEPKNVEIAEIEPAVMEASNFFQHFTGDPVRHPGVKLFLEDGRKILTYSPKHYDVIISEPSNPWISGINFLFTEDFYRIVRSHLNDGGVFCQWFPIYELTPATLGRMMSSMRNVFPETLLFEAGSDLLCIASKGKPLYFDRDTWRRVPQAAIDDLESLGIRGPEYFVARMVNDRQMPGDLERRNTDDNGFVEFHAPWELPMFLPATQWITMDDLRTPDPLGLWRRVGWPCRQGADLEGMLGAFVGRGRPDLALALLEKGRAQGFKVSPSLDRTIRTQASQFGNLTWAERGQRIVALANEASRLADGGMMQAAIKMLQGAAALSPRDGEIAYRLSLMYYQSGNLAEARRVVEEQILGGQWPRRYDALVNLSNQDRRGANLDSAEKRSRQALRMDPYRDEAYLELAMILAIRGRRDQAAAMIQQGMELAQSTTRLSRLLEKINTAPSSIHHE